MVADNGSTVVQLLRYKAFRVVPLRDVTPLSEFRFLNQSRKHQDRMDRIQQDGQGDKTAEMPVFIDYSCKS
jgi:hypothetical protein